jgi:hypothetical protein
MGSSSIISYLGQLLRGQQLCFRMKLMLVGQENVGYGTHNKASVCDGTTHYLHDLHRGAFLPGKRLCFGPCSVGRRDLGPWSGRPAPGSSGRPHLWMMTTVRAAFHGPFTNPYTVYTRD